VVRQPEFLLLVAAMTLGGFCVYAVVVNLVPLLNQNGISTTQAAVALGIGGAGQVAGRVFYGPVLTRLTARARTIATLAAASVTTLALGLVHQPLAVVCALSFAAGIARASTHSSRPPRSATAGERRSTAHGAASSPAAC
jgi:predicted MFS family arabinose efflux permease